MNIKRLYSVALAAALILSCVNVNAQQKLNDKKRLSEENLRLREVIDSLKMELERYRADFDASDSLAAEMMAAYGENIEMGSDEIAADAEEQPIEYTAETSDSLLNIWYTQKLVIEDIDVNLDSVKFQSNVPDEVYVERIKKMNSFITLPYNDIVKNYIIKYSEKMPERMSHMLGLCNYYMPIFEETLNKYDMPEELKAMAIIESAMNPLAVSRVGAKGMWQFMYGTAKIYGLHIDSFVDERLDPVKSADAAARYLQDAYEIFGDWNLAIASYNCGAGNVNKAIRRAGGKRAFWDIWPYLPRETRGYVPAFVGALYTLNFHKEHGIKPAAVGMPVAVDTFKITKQLHLKQVSELTGAPLDELKNLNPQYRHEIIPGNEKEYLLRIPYTYTNAFIEHEDSLYRHKADVYFNPVTIKKIKDGGDGESIIYKVKSGDYLGKIAARYRVSVAQIKKWNKLKSNDIRVGQRLLIYRGGNVPATQSSSSSAKPAAQTTTQTSSKPGNSAANAKGHVTYTVKSGDSFYSISKNYPGVSAQNIMDYNGFTSSSLRAGMVIKIPQF